MIEIIEEVINRAIKEYDIHLSISKSARLDLCDYQCNDIFKIAKIKGENPIDLGSKIVDLIRKMDDFEDYFDAVEFVRPGFINIRISSKCLNQFLKGMMTNDKFNLKKPEKIETFVIDYGGANVAKPLHVGHMRTAMIGESIKRIIEYMGHKTISDVHLGDYGLQIGQVIYGLKREGITPDHINIHDLDRIYPLMSKSCKEDEALKEKCAMITKELQEGNLEYQGYFKKICEVSIHDIKKVYDYLDVHFDLWFGESDSYPYISKVEKILQDKGILEVSDGASVVFVNEPGDKIDIPPLIFKKANGAYMYASTDVATILQRIEDYQPDHILYVVDNRQAMHFQQVFRTCEKADMISIHSLEHLGYGTVNGMDGKPYKTRSGDTPKLQELFLQTKEIFINKRLENQNIREEDLDIIVNAILKFADLMNSREKDYIFDINKFSEVVGKTGPYILYTYLRINKVLNNFDISINNLTDNIYNNYDRDLRLKLAHLNDYINQAFKERKPSYIADYLYDLCVLANTFYQNNHIMNLEDLTKRNDWLCILDLTDKVIKQLLNLMAIGIPVSM